MEEENCEKRVKWSDYITAFNVFQVMVILVFALVGTKVAPKFRVGDLEIQTLSVDQASPSFDMRFVASIRVKNTTFGPYNYDATTVDFTYGGVVLGQVNIPKSEANLKSTTNIDVEISLNSSELSTTTSFGLTNELNILGSQGKMNGKVPLMLLFKKKSTEMNCSTVIDVASKAVKCVECK